MANEMVVRSEFSTQLAEMDQIYDMCKKLLSTKHYQKLGEEGIHAILARSKALGISPVEALNNGFFVVQGRVGMSTEMMAALVRKRGHSIQKDSKSNADICILHGKRVDNGDVWTCQFSKEDAIAAGLWNSQTWKKYPAVMLYNRCMSMLFRQLFPDLSLGAGYVEDELKEMTKTGDYAANLPVAETEEVKQEPKKNEVQKITQDQYSILVENIGGDQECQKKVDGFLSTLGIVSLLDLPAAAFNKTMKGILNHHSTKCKLEPTSMDEVEIQEMVDE